VIIFLTGPSGSGKTDTSWELLKKFDDLTFLDCDWFASKIPFSWEKCKDVEMVYKSLAKMIQFHMREYQKKNFVITLTSQMAATFESQKSIFDFAKMPMYAFRLRCSNEVLQQRIHDRNRVQKDQELKDALKQQQFFDETFPNNDLFIMIDVTKLSEPEVVDVIYSHIKA